ncbi:MAG: type II toxin-antitoxin system VapC family toxin [Vicinamibacteria bacterium]
MIRYFDASAIVKRYVREEGTALVRRLLAGSPPATSRLSEVEVASAVARRSREGTLSAAARDRVLRAWAADLQALHLVEITDETAGIARALLLRHPLRAGDAIQLASCLILQQSLRSRVPLVAFDDRLRDAAVGEGLTVVP